MSFELGPLCHCVGQTLHFYGIYENIIYVYVLNEYIYYYNIFCILFADIHLGLEPIRLIGLIAPFVW